MLSKILQATEQYISSTFLRESPVPFYERYTSWLNWTNYRFAAFYAFFIFQYPLILLISYTFFYIIWHQIWHQNRISFFFRGLGIFSKIAGTRINTEDSKRACRGRNALLEKVFCYLWGAGHALRMIVSTCP